MLNIRTLAINMRQVFKLLIFLLAVISTESCNLFSAAGLSNQGQPIKEVTDEIGAIENIPQAVVDHSEWDILLKKYVDTEGMVDYKGFLKDREALNSYLRMLSENAPTNDWSVQELLAYYINTYNAYTINLILNNYPVKSIKDISGPWTKGIVPIGDKNLSLGGLENGVLRKMNEARIHFAINCASISCPNLLNEAFKAETIDEQLDRVTRGFINSDKNEFSSKTLKLSSIFDWYKKDFTVNGEVDVVGFINQYSESQLDSNIPIGYKEYNWNLNEKKQ